MKIAQVAPLIESVPPRLYGGTERVVAYLTEELVRQGHQVTLYASADSETSAELRPMATRALRLDRRAGDPLIHHYVMLERVLREAHEHDIVHFHTDFLHFPLARRHDFRHLTTLHGRLDVPSLKIIFEEFDDMPLVSISESQRRPLPDANWRATVYNGVPHRSLHLHPQPGTYLAFLGRISPEKRPDRAIEIARRAGWAIKLAAKVDRADEEYFESVIRPLLREPGVEFVGEIAEHEKDKFLGEAAALLFPIDWPEPFGLVMIEAMACGTPVIAFRGGAVDEVMRDGVTGFIVEDMEQAVQAVGELDRIDRRMCRRVFEDRFSAERMAQRYVAVYEHALAGRSPIPNLPLAS